MNNQARSAVVARLHANCVQRTQFACVGFAAMFSLGEILVLMHQPLSQTLSKLPLYANLAGAGASLLCLGGLRSKSLGLHSKVLLCHAFLLLTAAAIAFGEASSRTVGNGFGQSRLTLLIILSWGNL